MVRNYSFHLIIGAILWLIAIGQSKAQQEQLAPAGATWYYNYFQGQVKFTPTYGYSTITVVKDTFLQSKKCQLLRARHYKQDGTMADEREFIIQTKGTTVNFYKDQQFHLLYDFAAQPQSFQSIQVPDPELDTSFATRIDSVKEITFASSQTRKVFYLTLIPTLGWKMSPTVLEGIGGLRAFLPYRKFEKRKTPIGLRCFSDKSSLPPVLSKCKATFQMKNIPIERQQDTLLQIQPPPALHKIYTYQEGKADSITKPMQVSVFNARGQMFITKSFPFGTTKPIINLAPLENGKYYLKVEVSQKSFTQPIRVEK